MQKSALITAPLLTAMISAALLTGCNSANNSEPEVTLSLSTDQTPFQPSDFVADNVFTQGVEGPAVDRDGNLYAVNFASEGTIGQITAKDKAALYITLPEGSVANGIRFDQQGNMYLADYVGHNVLKVAAGSTDVTVFAHEPRMNQPNDLAIADNGTLFASDPNWAKSTGQLWKISAAGEITLLEDNMGTTNGVEVSPDNRTLYVNESVQRKVWAYDLDADGNISNKRLLIEFADHGMDGMRTDAQGNLYIARYGAGEVAVVSPQGKLIRQIALKGQFPTNVAFGGPDGKTVYVTLQKRGAIETFRSDTPGRAHALWSL